MNEMISIVNFVIKQENSRIKFRNIIKGNSDDNYFLVNSEFKINIKKKIRTYRLIYI